jgi:hypothetical protein
MSSKGSKKKRYDTDAIANELQRSAFFASVPPPSPPSASAPQLPQEPPRAATPVSEAGRVDSTTAVPQNPQPRNHGNAETRPPSAPVAVPPVPPATTTFEFDPFARAEQKYTLQFTEPELEAIEDIKLDLRRRLGMKISKIDLVRCGLGELIEDYQQHGDESRLVQRLRTRTHRTSHEHAKHS